MLSVFSEIRSGPLSGLRFYYDKAPESNFVTEDGNQGYWGWSSLSLGWSFATPLPKFVKPILSQFDIYPKIGYLNLASRMTARDLDGNFYPIDLKIDKKLLLGLELGAEHPFLNSSLMRLWFSYSKMYDRQSAVSSAYSSLKTGLDFYWDLFSMGSTRLKFLTFGLFQYDNLTGTLSLDERLNDIEKQTFPIAYRLYFVGAGVTLAW
jgi:hypothetical protein